jgi:predicted Zn finger-like uncharacterized protein
MFTVCPKCALTLVVTAADLRVAQGYVRCGRCSSVFNALARLTDERQAAAASGEPDPGSAAELDPASAAEPDPAAAEAAGGAQPPGEPADGTAETSASATEAEVIPEAALEFNPARIDVTALFVEPEPDPQWTAATGSFKAMIAANQEGAAGEQPQAQAAPAPAAPPPPPPPEDTAVEVEVDAAFLAQLLSRGGALEPPPAAAPAAAAPAAAAPAAAVPAAAAPAPVFPVPAGSHPTPPAARAPAPQAPGGHAAAVDAVLAPAARAPAPWAPGGQPAAADPVLAPATYAARATAAPADPGTPEEGAMLAARALPHAWAAGTGLALLLLLGQIVNHYRDRLAADTRFNHALTSLYGAFGVKLAPAWDLRAYDVRQLGASVDSTSNGLITVRASVKNGARQPQPLPLLRVTLEDRFGNRIASRDVAPRFYLPPAVPASSLLASGQRVDAQMGFIDPGASAVGFEIDACLPASGGAVTCANDASGR